MADKKSAIISGLKTTGKIAKFASTTLLDQIMPNTVSTVNSIIYGARELQDISRRTFGSIKNKFDDKSSIDTYNSAMKDMLSGSYSIDKIADDNFTSYNELDFNGENDSDNNQSSEIGKAVISGSSATIDSIKQMTETLSLTQIKSSKASSDRQTKIALMGINTIGAGLIGVNSRLDVINKNLVQMIRFQNENTSIVNKSLLKYFDLSLDKLTNLEKQNSMPTAKNYKKNKMSFMDNGFDLSEYITQVKSNFEDSLLGTSADLGASMMKLMGPSMIPKMILSFLLPQSAKQKGLGKLDSNIQKYIKEAFYKIGDMQDSSSMIGQMFGEIFGSRRPVKNSINLGNFHKENMGWNGIAQKTLVEVIPGYLAKIESSLSKQEERYYDMNTGRFKNLSAIKEDYGTNEDNDIRSNLSSAINRLNTILMKNNIGDDKKKQIEESLTSLVKERIDGNSKASDNYKKTIKKDLGDIMSKNDFAGLIMDIEEGIRGSIESSVSRNSGIENDNLSSSVYKNMMNSSGYSINKDKDITRSNNLFKQNRFMSSYNPEYAKPEFIINIAKPLMNDIPFKMRPGFIKSYQKALMNEATYDELRRIIRAEAKYQRNLLSKNKISSKFNKIPGVGNVIGGINTAADYVDEKLFDVTMGFDKVQGKASSRKSKFESGQEVVSTNYKRDTDSLEKEFEKMDPLKSNEAKIEMSTKKIQKTVESANADAKMNPASQTSLWSSVRTSILSALTGFGNMVGGLFGKDGFMRKFIGEILGGDKIKALFNKLFNEEGGPFKEVTKTFKDSMDYVKYIFSGKGYTNRKGKEFKDNENNVFKHLKDAYQGIFTNTMKYVFGNDYESNSSYNKFFSWMNLNKSKSKAKVDINGRGETVVIEDKIKSKTTQLPATIANIEDNMSFDKIDSNINRSSTVHGAQLALIDSVDKVTSKIETNGNNLVEVLVGNIDNTEEKEKVKEGLFKKFKDNLPKTIGHGIVGAGVGTVVGIGGAGLVGSLFMPGGPIGGAILGIGLSIASRSKGLQDFLFGKFNSEEGKKTGGLISQRGQNAMKKALPFMIGGAVLGTAKQLFFGSSFSPMGFLASTLFGPFGGAVLGLSSSLLLNSEKFNKILFGEKGEDGKNTGGIFAKGMNAASSIFAKSKKFVFGGIKGAGIGALTGAVVSQMGILGASLSMGGPIGMGIAGLGIGIASSTNKFQQMLFGTEEVGPDGKVRKLENGIMHKVRNMLVVNIFDPVKQKVSDEMENFAYWAKKNIMFPFKLAFGPIIDSFTGLKDDIGDFVKDKFDKISDGVSTLITGAFKTLFSPITSLLGNVLKGAVTVVSTATKLALSPLTGTINLMRMITTPGRAKNYMDFYKAHGKNTAQTLSDQWAQDNEDGKSKGFIGKGKDIFNMFFNPTVLNESKKAYNEQMGLEGRNALDWRNTPEEMKKAKLEHTETLKKQKVWKNVDKIRQNIANEDKTKSIIWTDKRTNDIRKKLQKAGITTGIDSERDIKQLIFDKDDWKDKFQGKNSSATISSTETKDQQEARKNTGEYQESMKDMMARLLDLMSASATDNANKYSNAKSEKKKNKNYNRFVGRMRKAGIDPSSKGFRDIPDIMDIPMHEFDNYRDSPFYKSGNIGDWYNKNRSRWAKDSTTEEKARSTQETNTDSVTGKKTVSSAVIFKNTSFDSIETLGHGFVKPSQLNKMYKRYQEKGYATTPTEFLEMVIGKNYKGKIEEAKSRPTAARGGLIEKPTTITAGEDGVEAIVPLEKNIGWINKLAEGIKNSVFPSKNIKKPTTLDDVVDAIDNNKTETVDRLDSLNEASYGLNYKRGDRSRNIGKPLSAKAIGEANITQSEHHSGFGSAITNSFGSVFNKFFGNKKKDEEKNRREEEENAESIKARGLATDSTALLPVLDSAISVSDSENNKKDKKEGLFSKIFKWTGGIFGSVLSSISGIFANMSTPAKLLAGTAVGAVIMGAIGEYIGPLVSPIFDWIGVKLFGEKDSAGNYDGDGLISKARITIFGGIDANGTEVDGLMNKLTRFVFGGIDPNGNIVEGNLFKGIDAISNFLVDNGDRIINVVTKTLVPLVPSIVQSLVTLGWAAIKGTGNVVGNIAGAVGDKYGLTAGVDRNISPEKARALQMQGKNVYYNENGQLDYLKDRTYVDHNGEYASINSNFIESMPGYAATAARDVLASTAGSGVYNVTKGAISKTAGGIARGATNIASIPMRFVPFVGNKAASALGKGAGKFTGASVDKGIDIANKFVHGGYTKKAKDAAIKSTGSAIIEKGTREAIENAGEAAVKSVVKEESLTIVKKFITKATETIMNLVNNPSVTKMLNKFGMNADKIIGVMAKTFNKSAPKALSAIGDKAAAWAAKITAKVTAGVAKDTTSGATLGIAIAVFAVFDATTGALEADRLFGVGSKEVDATMRMVSSLYKVIAGLPIVWIVDLAFELISGLLNLDIKREIATAIYKFCKIGNPDDIKTLSRAQASLDIEAENYNNANGTNLSSIAYKEKKNKSAGGKFKGFLFGDKSEDLSMYSATAEQLEMRGIDSTGYSQENSKSKFKGIFPDMDVNFKKGWDVFTNGLASTTDKIKKLFASVGDVGNFIKNFGSGLVKNAFNGKETFVNFNKDDPLLSVKLIAYEGIKFLMQPISLVSQMSGNAYREIQIIIDKIKNNLLNKGIASGKEITDANITALTSSEYWNYTDDPENPLSGFDKACFLIGRMINAPIALFKESGDLVSSAISNIVDKIKNNSLNKGLASGKEITNANITALTSSEYWNYTDDPENPLSGFDKACFLMGRMINAPIALFKESGDLIGKAMSDGINGLKKIPDRVKSITSEKPTDIFSGAYWDFKADSANPFDWITRSLFYINRVLTFIPDAFTQLFGDVQNPVKWLVDLVGGKVLAANSKNISVTDNAESVSYGNGPSDTLSQYDPRWSGYKLGRTTDGKVTTMANGGCGPVALSEVARSMGYNNISPISIAANGKAKGYISNGGSTEDMMTKGASDIGLSANTETSDSFEYKIKNGIPVIISGVGNGDTRNSPFTNSGHIVTATGMDNNGKIIIKDPRTGKSIAYDKNIIKKNMTGAWSYGRNKGYGGAEINATEDFSSDPMNSISGIFGKLTKVAGSAISSLISGNKYSRVLNDDGSYINDSTKSNMTSKDKTDEFSIGDMLLPNPISSNKIGENWFKDTLKARVSSNYGRRSYVDSYGKYVTDDHKGIDFACPVGTPIYTPISGRIVTNKLHNLYGNYVEIEDDNKYRHKFAHMKSMSPYSIGEYVNKGACIGYSGNTGNSSGPHLHYEIIKPPYRYPTDCINPSSYPYKTNTKGYGGLDTSSIKNSIFNDNGLYESVSSSAIEKNGMLQINKGNNSTSTMFNINNSTLKNNKHIVEESTNIPNLNSQLLIKKLDVAVNTDKVEDKLDILIGVARELVTVSGSHKTISYGDTNVNSTPNVISVPQQKTNPDYSGSDLVALHNKIARGRRDINRSTI